VERLVALQQRILPVEFILRFIRASGDLAPLAHLSLPLLGEGEVNFECKKSTFKCNNGTLTGSLLYCNRRGLALLNGTQFMSAYGAYFNESK
jgi:histidine ammonia-lyase